MSIRKLKKYIRRQQRIGKALGRPAIVNCGLYWFTRFCLKPAGGYPTGPLIDFDPAVLDDGWTINYDIPK